MNAATEEARVDALQRPLASLAHAVNQACVN